MGERSDIEGDAARALEALRRAAHFLAHYEETQAALHIGSAVPRSPLTALVEEGVDAADRVLSHLRGEPVHRAGEEWAVVAAPTAPWSVLAEQRPRVLPRRPAPMPPSGGGDPGE